MLVAIKVSALEGKVFSSLLDLNSFCQGFQTHLKARANSTNNHAENVSIITVARALNLLARVAQPAAHLLIRLSAVSSWVILHHLSLLFFLLRFLPLGCAISIIIHVFNVDAALFEEALYIEIFPTHHIVFLVIVAEVL